MIKLTVDVCEGMEKTGKVKPGDIIVVDKTPKSTLKSFVYLVTESKEYPKCDLKGLGTGQRLRNVRFEVNEYTADELKNVIYNMAKINPSRIHIYDASEICIDVTTKDSDCCSSVEFNFLSDDYDD